jgi:hypothetical protein
VLLLAQPLRTAADPDQLRGDHALYEHGGACSGSGARPSARLESCEGCGPRAPAATSAAEGGGARCDFASGLGACGCYCCASASASVSDAAHGWRWRLWQLFVGELEQSENRRMRGLSQHARHARCHSLTRSQALSNQAGAAHHAMRASKRLHLSAPPLTAAPRPP